MSSQHASAITARLDRLPLSRHIWVLVALLSLGGWFELYDLLMTAYVSPALIDAKIFAAKDGLFGLPDQAAFASVTFAGLFVGTILFAQVADRYGRRAIFTFSLIWYAVATAIMAMQSTRFGIDLWRFIAGIGVGVELVTIDTYVTELVPKAVRGRVFAVNQAIQFSSAPVAAGLSALLIDHAPLGLAGWRWVALVPAVGALVAWWIRRAVPESPRWLAQQGRAEEAEAVIANIEAKVAADTGAPLPAPGPALEEHGGAGFAEIWHPPYRARTIMLSVFNFFQTIGFYGFGNWVPALLAAQGVTFTKSATYAAVIAIAYPIGPLLCAYFADAVERKWQIVGAAFGTAVFGLLFWQSGNTVGLLILFGVLITMSNNLLSYAYHAYQAELFPTRVRARAVGFVYSFSRLSTVFTSFMIGFFLKNFGNGGVFGFIAFAMVMVMISIGLFGPRTSGLALEEILRRAREGAMSAAGSNVRPAPDQVLVDIADYVLGYEVDSALAFATARNCLIDTLGCGLEALEYPSCTKLLGPIVPGTVVPNGAKVPGTAFQLDPVQAAFNIGTMIRWLDFNDCWLAAEWGHPSDNLGAILAVADWLSRNAVAAGKAPLTMRDVLAAMIKAHEIQGCLALENSFNQVGIDHVVLVKVASTAVVCGMLGLTRDETINALSLAFVDGQSLRTYRHAPNTGSRKSWAAGDATSRAVRLALIARTGEMGYPSVLRAKRWGFYDVVFRGKPFVMQRPYGSYVMENVLFKISFPAEFHAQTAVEAALAVRAKLAAMGKTAADIAQITIRTQRACIEIIDKSGPLNNPADRDHCIQYMVAVPLIFGRLTAPDYEDGVATDPRIDPLRAKMTCVEDPAFTRDYHDPTKRSIANALTVRLADGTTLDEVVVEYPIGHQRRRAEGLPHLEAKFRTNLARRFPPTQQARILDVSLDQATLERMPVNAYVDLYVT